MTFSTFELPRLPEGQWARRGLWFVLLLMAWCLSLTGAWAAAGGGPSTGGGGAGSITNLSPNVATLALTTPATVNVNTSARLLTNWNTGTASNMVTDVSGTNGFIRITNAGWYHLHLAVTYRSAGTAIRTNQFGITTNVGGVGLVGVGSTASSVSQYASNLQAEAVSRAVYVPSNTFVAASFLHTIGATNDLVIENATLWASSVAGSTFGSSSSGSGGGASTNANQFGVSSQLTLKDGVLVTNATVRTSLSVPGNQTNTGGGWLVMEDGTVTTIMIYGNIGGPAILSSNATIDFGPWAKTVTFDSTGNGRLGYGSQPYGSLGYGTPTTYTGGFDMLAASNGVFANTIALKGVTASRAVVINGAGLLTNATSADPANEYLKADGTTGVPAGGTGGTNYPPVIQLGVSTNVTVGSGVRQSVTLITNASFALNFAGTPRNGEQVRVAVSNFSANANIFLTNYNGGAVANVYDPQFGSNTTVFLIASNSIRYFSFVWNTNFNNGTVRQELEWTTQFSYGLAAGGQGRFSTNGATVTHYQSFSVDYIDAGAFLTNATNWSATYNYTNHIQGAGPQVFYTFGETATNEVYVRLTAPAAYDGTPIKAKFHWTSTNTISLKTNTWGILGRKASGTDWDNATFGTRVDIRSAHSGGKEFNTSPATANVTINGSPAGGDLVVFKLVRDPNDANDNMVGETRLHAVEIQWGLTNAVVASW